MECVTRFLEYASPAEKRKLSQTLDTVSLWQHLDDKTRGNVQSTLLNALRPLLSLSAAGCFEPQNRPLFDVAGVATRGAVCVASVNATTDPDLASLFFKLVKQDFFGAVQQRSTGAEPLCAVLVDELPLLVAKEDAEVLATVRSRRCSVVSATQSLSAIDERVGVRTRKALLGNFGTIIFMRGREEEVDTFAATHLGTRVQVETFRTTVDEGGLLSEARGKMRHRVWVCPPGTLGRLEPHQGFVALPGNSRQDHPLTFVPWFEEHRDPAFEDPASLPHLQSLLRRHGLREENDDLSVKVALLLCSDESQHDRVLEEATGFFRAKCALVPRGLETLPVAWLKALPKILWSLRQPHWTQLPFMISEVCGDGGLLRVRFAQETPCPPKQDRVTAWDWIRVKINSSLYPSRWRPLTPRHRHHIGARKLELSSPGASTIT